MKIYHPTGASMTDMVTPGVFNTETSDFMDAQGKPIRFDVQFVNGVATVPEPLGKWMIGKGRANRTRLIRVQNTLQRVGAALIG